MDIGSLTGQITLNDDLSSALDLAQAKVTAFAESFEGMNGAIVAGAGFWAAAIGAVDATVFGLAEHAATAAESVENFNIKTGLAVEKIGPLQFAVTAAGGSLEQLNSTLMRLTMKEAADSGGKFSAALVDLGINATAFGKMNAEEKILALGEGFRNGAIHGTNMSDSLALMSRNGANMIPILEKMTPELMAMAQTSGIIWSQDDLDRAHAFDVSMSAMEQTIGNISTRIGIELLPAMSELLTNFAKSPEFIDNVTLATTMFAHGLGYAVEGAGYLTTGFISLGSGAVNLYGMIAELAVGIDKFVLSALQNLSLIPGMAPKLAGAIATVSEALKTNETSVVSAHATYDKLVTVGGFVYDTSQKIGQVLLSVGGATDKVTEATKQKAAADVAAAAETAKHEAAVKTLVDTLTGNGKAMSVIQDAYKELSDSGQLYGDTLQRMLPELEKLTKGHIALTDAQREVQAAGIETRVAMEGFDQEVLTSKGVTLESIEVQKKHGLTMQEIADLLHVDVKALGDWATGLTTTAALEAAALKKSGELWNDWAKIVGDDIYITQYEKAGAAIDDTARHQQTVLDEEYAKRKTHTDQELADYLANSAQIATNQLAAWNVLNERTKESDKTSQEYANRRALEAQAAYDDAVRLSGGIETAATTALRATADAAALTAATWTANLGPAIDDTVSKIDRIPPAAAAAAASIVATATSAYTTIMGLAGQTGAGGTAAQAAAQLALQRGAGTTPIYGAGGYLGEQALGYYKPAVAFDEGGPVRSTGPAIVHGGEYVVPKEGALVSSGGGGDTYHITVQGSVLSDPSKIAAAVDNAITTRQRRLGRALSTGVTS